MQQTVAQSVARPLIYNYGLARAPKSHIGLYNLTTPLVSR